MSNNVCVTVHRRQNFWKFNERIQTKENWIMQENYFVLVWRHSKYFFLFWTITKQIFFKRFINFNLSRTLVEKVTILVVFPVDFYLISSCENLQSFCRYKFDLFVWFLFSPFKFVIQIKKCFVHFSFLPTQNFCFHISSELCNFSPYGKFSAVLGSRRFFSFRKFFVIPKKFFTMFQTL